MEQIQNASITKISIDREHCLTAWVFVQGDGWGCGFGGYSLDTWNEQKQARIGTAYGMEFIKRIMETLESETWEGLAGKSIRIVTDGCGGRILKIGHYLKDRWFDPKELAKEFGLDKQD